MIDVPPDIAEFVIKFQSLIAAKQYDEAVQTCGASIITVNELRKAIDDYGKTIKIPTVKFIRENCYVQHNSEGEFLTSIDAPFFTEEEGMSDLEVRLAIGRTDGRYELQDVLVP